MSKRVIYILGVLIALAIAAGGYFLIAAKKAEDATLSGEAGGATGADRSTPVKETPSIAEGEHALGSPSAKLTIVEYFSLGCPHCARFHTEILPQLKKDYIDTGKVRLVFRDFPLDQPALAAAMIASCLPGDGYYAMVDTLFAQQATWHIPGAQAALTTIAKGVGMDQAKLDSCLGDKTARDHLLAVSKEGQQKFDVESTPTFIVGDRKLTGIGSYADFKASVDAQLAKTQ